MTTNSEIHDNFLKPYLNIDAERVEGLGDQVANVPQVVVAVLVEMPGHGGGRRGRAGSTGGASCSLMGGLVGGPVDVVLLVARLLLVLRVLVLLSLQSEIS